MEKKRFSNLELARLVAIVLIILYHITIFRRDADSLRIYDSGFQFGQIWAYSLQMWGLTGVGIFFLISGWFLQEVEKVDVKKVILIILAVYFYNTIDMVVSIICGFNDKSLIYNLYSIMISPLKFWYIPAYVFMYITAPWIRRIVKTISAEKLGRVLTFTTLVLPIFSSLFGGGITLSDCGFAVYYFVLVIWMKNNPDNMFEKHKRKILISCVLFVFICAMSSTLLFHRVPGRIFEIIAGRFSIIQIITAISLFYMFMNLNIGSVAVINRLAACTLGVYLIHESEIVRYFIWQKLIPLGEKFSDKKYPIYVFIGLIIILIGSLIIELLRQELLEKYIKKLSIISRLSMQ